MSLELNKIAAAVLTGGVIAMGSGFVAKLLVHEEHLEQSVYLPAGMDAPAEQTAEAEPMLEPVLPLLASASVDSGETITRKCTACHAFEKGGANKVGPALWGVVGAQIASHEGYSYSEALQNAPDDVWTYSALNAFMASPADYAPGTKMSYAGLSSVQDRADLIAYLRTLADDPLPLPSEEEISAVTASAEAAMDAAGEAAGEAAEGMAEAAGDMAEGAAEMAEEAAGGGILAMIASADPADGEKATRKCAACHSFDEGGPNKIGPNLWDLVAKPIAGKEGYKYSDALGSRSGETWSYEALDGYLENPKGWAPGTKMSFAGVKKPEQRADLIAYLRSLSGSPAPLP